LQMVRESGLLTKLFGKIMEEAKSIQLDAVSGATFTSTALIKNIQLGLADGVGGHSPLEVGRGGYQVFQMKGVVHKTEAILTHFFVSLRCQK